MHLDADSINISLQFKKGNIDVSMNDHVTACSVEDREALCLE